MKRFAWSVEQISVVQVRQLSFHTLCCEPALRCASLVLSAPVPPVPELLPPSGACPGSFALVAYLTLPGLKQASAADDKEWKRLWCLIRLSDCRGLPDEMELEETPSEEGLNSEPQGERVLPEARAAGGWRATARRVFPPCPLGAYALGGLPDLMPLLDGFQESSP